MRPQVNLLPKYEKYSNLSYIIFVICLILFLILAGTLTYLFFKERNVLEKNETQVSSLTEQKQILEARLSSRTETDTTTLSDAVAFAKSHAVPVSKLVDEVMLLLPDNSYLVNYHYDYHTLSVDTRFETMTDTADYMELLTESKFLMNSKVEYIGTEDQDGENDEEQDGINYSIIPRYLVTYTMDVNQKALMEEEKDE